MARISTYVKDNNISPADLLLGSEFIRFNSNGFAVYKTKNYNVSDLSTFFGLNSDVINTKLAYFGDYDENGNLISISQAFGIQTLSIVATAGYASATALTSLGSRVDVILPGGGNVVSESFANQVLNATSSTRFASTTFATNLASSFGSWNSDGSISVLSSSFADNVFSTMNTSSLASASYVTNLSSSLGTFNADGTLASLSSSFADNVFSTMDTSTLASAASVTTLNAELILKPSITRAATAPSIQQEVENELGAVTTPQSPPNGSMWIDISTTAVTDSSGNVTQQPKNEMYILAGSAGSVAWTLTKDATLLNTITSLATAEQSLTTVSDAQSATATFATNLAANFGSVQANGNGLDLSAGFADQILSTQASSGSSISELNTALGASITLKPNIFRQASVPTSLAIGDIWFDTDDKNKMYVAQGIGNDEVSASEWILTADERLADTISSLATTNQNLTAESTARGSLATFTTGLASNFGTVNATTGVFTDAAGVANQILNTSSNNLFAKSSFVTNLVSTFGSTDVDGNLTINAAFADSVLSTQTSGTLATAASVTSLGTAISDETSARQSAITNTQQSVTDEASVRASADTALSTSISNESSTRSAAITTTQQSVVDEASARAAADTALSASITAEGVTRAAAFTSNQTAISNEASARATADTALSASITAEGSTRASAITTLNTAITDEASTRASAITNVQSNITAEGVTRSAAVTTLTDTIATVDGKLGASYALTVGAGNAIAGMKLLSNGTTSTVSFSSDQFNIYTAGGNVRPFTVSGNVVTMSNVVITGALNGATGTFSGSLSAATGTFAGSLSAASGTFAGSLSAATGSFSGAITATSLTLSAGVTLGAASVTGLAAVATTGLLAASSVTGLAAVATGGLLAAASVTGLANVATTGSLVDVSGVGALASLSTVNSTYIDSNSITTAKIAAGAITAGTIAAGAIIAGKIAAGTIVANDIAAGAIVASKISANEIDATKISSLSFSGKTATFDTGSIGGWNIGSTTLTSTNNLITLSSGNYNLPSTFVTGTPSTANFPYNVTIQQTGSASSGSGTYVNATTADAVTNPNGAYPNNTYFTANSVVSGVPTVFSIKFSNDSFILSAYFGANKTMTGNFSARIGFDIYISPWGGVVAGATFTKTVGGIATYATNASGYAYITIPSGYEVTGTTSGLVNGTTYFIRTRISNVVFQGQYNTTGVNLTLIARTPRIVSGTINYAVGRTEVFGGGMQVVGSSDYYFKANRGTNTAIAPFLESAGFFKHYGDLNVVGTLDASTKNFKIDHPLDSMNETHYLVHSSIEGPRADLIYRGRIRLYYGRAFVNIDLNSGMTNGTFESLCTNVQCFTTNETSWYAVKASVDGNILYIESENENSIDDISWMVVGERKDYGVVSSTNTDSTGKLIVEIEK